MNFQAVLKYSGKVQDVLEYQDDRDIVREMKLAHKRWASEYDKIVSAFWRPGDDIGIVCRRIWEYLKSLKYKRETEYFQTVKSPGAIVRDDAPGGRDCKHFSLFAAGVLDAIRRRMGKKADFRWFFLFVSNRRFDYPTHVLIEVDTGGEKIYLDAVEKSFNFRRNWFYQEKVNAMLSRVSGLSGVCGCSDSPSAENSSGGGYLPAAPATVPDAAFQTGLSQPVTITAKKPVLAGLNWLEIILLAGVAVGAIYAVNKKGKNG